MRIIEEAGVVDLSRISLWNKKDFGQDRIEVLIFSVLHQDDEDMRQFLTKSTDKIRTKCKNYNWSLNN